MEIVICIYMYMNIQSWMEYVWRVHCDVTVLY